MHWEIERRMERAGMESEAFERCSRPLSLRNYCCVIASSPHISHRSSDLSRCFSGLWPLCSCVPYVLCMLLCCVLSDGISVTGLPISSPLRQVLKPRTENKPVGTDASKNEFNHIKVLILSSSWTHSLHFLLMLCSRAVVLWLL